MLLRCLRLQRRYTKHKTCGPMSSAFDLEDPIVTPSDVETNETNPNHVLKTRFDAWKLAVLD